MANRNQQRGGQHPQDSNADPSRNQMGGVGQQSGNAQQSAYQGNSQGQFGGNHGQDTNYRGTQEYGNYYTQGDFRGYADNSNARFGNDVHSRGRHESNGDYGISRDAGYNPRETNANEQWEPENSRGPRGYGHSQSYGGAMAHVDDIQRGSHSWQQHADRFQHTATPGGYNQPLSGNDQGGYEGHFGIGGGQHHDPDYHQWRTEQIRGLDNDYKAWRDERYTNFSNEFGEWRKGRKDEQSASGSDASSSTGNPSNVSVNTAPKGK